MSSTSQHLHLGGDNGVFPACKLVSVVGYDDSHKYSKQLFSDRTRSMLDEVVSAQHFLGPAHQACNDLKTEKRDATKSQAIESD